MKEKIIYVCDACGKTFEDKEDCYQHEVEHENEEFVNQIIAWDENYRKTKFSSAPTFLDTMTAFQCLTMEAAEWLREFLNDIGYESFRATFKNWNHLFFWDEDKGSWVDLDENFNYWNDIKNSFK